MADIFVSYAREDRPWVQRFTKVLHDSQGWEIWWDRSILPGDQFDEAIQKALNEARCAIVVWSGHSIGSRWVRSEAREAVERGILVPLSIGDVRPPLEFRSFQTADLSSWKGTSNHAGFAQLTEAVRRILMNGNVPDDGNQADSDPGNEQSPRGRPFLKAVAVIAILIAGIIALSLGVTREQSPPKEAVQKVSASIARPVPHLDYGTWTLHNALDVQGADFSNSALKFTSQEETTDGLTFRGFLTWRQSNVLVGTEEFEGRYEASKRLVTFWGTKLKQEPHPGPDRLALGSYSGVLSADERSIQDGRWGVTAEKRDPGFAGHWEATR